MKYTTERFLQVALEHWPEWNLNPRPLNLVHTLKQNELLGQEFLSHSEPILYSIFNFILGSVSDFISAILFVSRHVYF